jgi:DNA-binding CsgD family transcriptional regulator
LEQAAASEPGRRSWRASSEVVGRERELAAIAALLDSDERELRALVVEGEPGIGKSTVWQATPAEAVTRGLPVLSCRPVEAEAKLAFASLADMLAPVAELLPALPEPQRVALDVALLRTSPRGPAPHQRAVGTATATLLRRLGPLVVAVDDVQWLDRASASALAFALRRLEDRPLRVVVALRVDALATDPLAIPGRVERLRLAPLSLSGLYHVIRAHLGQVFPRPTLQRIAQASGGNPLFALELARALVATGARPGPGEPLPVPETLATLLEARLRRLPRPSRDALAAAAALAAPDAGVVARALGPDAAAALEAAEAAGIVTIRDERIRFDHPLLASTVYAATRAQCRRELHRALADAVEEPQERARHLALATAGEDEAVAASLAAAARDASARGAPQVAVDLAELAVRLTPSEEADARAERALELCEHVFRAGDTDEARRLVQTFAHEQPPGPLRARALELLARILHVAGTAAEAAACCEEALGEAGDDLELRARIHGTLALVSYHDFRVGREHSRAALDLLERLDDPDPGVLSQALWAHIGAEFESGHELPWPAVERALELERLSPAPHVADRISAALGVWLKLQGDFAGARHWLEATWQAAVDEGDDASLPYAVSHLPQLELWTGNWDAAEVAAREHLELAEQTAQPDQRRQALYNLALVHCHQGRTEEARAEAEELRTGAEAAGDAWGASNALATLGLLELSLGDPDAAAAHLARNAELHASVGSSEPTRTSGDYAEALLELGDLARASGVVRDFEARCRTADRAPLLAVAARSRALAAAAGGDLDAAAGAIDEALAQHERVTVPFDLARTLLAAGQIRRRRGERKAARDALERARATFEDLGAPLWAARAETELRRVPIRRGARDDGLTPTEEQVAELAAAGRTTREVAQLLFLSPKTVEANLTRIYRKLGVGSRAELGARIAERRAKP